MDGERPKIEQIFALKAFWNARALGAMLRKTHFVSILLSMWALPMSNVTWITDADEFVANDPRHDDALATTARFCSFYIPGPQGIFRLNTTTQDENGMNFEDLCSIPDLAAGMLSEVSTQLSQVGSWETQMEKALDGALPTKASILADWFWDTDMTLRKTMVSVDLLGKQYSVRKVDMLNVEGSAPSTESLSPES